jgi:hypothetical protein
LSKIRQAQKSQISYAFYSYMESRPKMMMTTTMMATSIKGGLMWRGVSRRGSVKKRG